MLKKMIMSLILIALIVDIASAANNFHPFSPGNAKVAFDKQDSEFQDKFILGFGLFWLCVGSFIVICLGGSASSYAAHKSGQFADPEKKSGGAVSMLGIIFIVLGLFICMSVVLPLFGFS